MLWADCVFCGVFVNVLDAFADFLGSKSDEIAVVENVDGWWSRGQRGLRRRRLRKRIKERNCRGSFSFSLSHLLSLFL